MRSIFRAALLVVLCCAVPCKLPARTWTDKKGKTIEAELIEVKGAVAVLKKEDGKTIRLPIAKLSDEDQEFLNESAPAKPPAKSAAKPTGKPATKAKGKPVAPAQDSTDAPEAESPPPAAQANTTAGIDIVGMAIYQAKPGGPDAAERLDSVFYDGKMPGTELTMHLSLAGKQLVALNDADCKLTTCADDTGRDLRKEISPGLPAGARWSDASHGREGGEPLVILNVPGIPAPGATKIHLAGEISVQCATGEKSEDQHSVALKAVGDITAGPVPMHVEPAPNQPAPPPFPMEGTFITLTTNRNEPLLKKIEFLDASGAPIRQSLVMWNWGVGFERTYGLLTKDDKVTVRIVSYSTIETVKLPFAIDFGVGLPTIAAPAKQAEAKPKAPVDAKDTKTLSMREFIDLDPEPLRHDEAVKKFGGQWLEVTGVVYSLGWQDNKDRSPLTMALWPETRKDGSPIDLKYAAAGAIEFVLCVFENAGDWKTTAYGAKVVMRGQLDKQGFFNHVKVIESDRLPLEASAAEFAKELVADGNAAKRKYDSRTVVLTGKLRDAGDKKAFAGRFPQRKLTGVAGLPWIGVNHRTFEDDKFNSIKPDSIVRILGTCRVQPKSDYDELEACLEDCYVVDLQ